MRSCRHCGHQNADHLGYCSQCGKRLGPVTAVPLSPRAPTPRPFGGGASGGGTSSTMAVTAALSATSPTMMSLSPGGQTPPPGPQAKINTARVVRPGPAGRAAIGLWSVLSWIADSIAYIYVYLRGKLDAGERRRRLVTERDGSQSLLAGAFKELGTAI